MPAPIAVIGRPSVALGVRITPEQQDTLRRLAERLDCRPSALARLALAQGLEQIERDQRHA